MNDTIKINNLYKYLGINLIDNGIQFLRKSFDPVAEIKSYGFIRESLNAIGLTNVVDVDMDIQYKFADWNVWQEILGMVNQILRKIPYLDNFLDCDNYAYFVSSFVPLVFGITCGEAFGKFTNSTTKKEFMHHFNLIISKTGNLYVYDGISGNSCQIIKDQPIKMGIGTYEIQNVKFF